LSKLPELPQITIRERFARRTSLKPQWTIRPLGGIFPTLAAANFRKKICRNEKLVSSRCWHALRWGDSALVGFTSVRTF
jgi:hypothetical protein